MNRNFAKLDENNRIIYAPDWVIRVDHHHEEWDEPVYDKDGNPVIDSETGKQKTEHKTQDWDTERRELHPTADDYTNAKDGPWLPLDNTNPEKDGVYFVSTEYGDLVDGRIVRRYDERPIVAQTPPVIRYSGWKMYKAIKSEGFGDAFDALMKADIGVMIAFVRPQYFLSNDEDFTSMVAKLCVALGIDDETKELILAASVDEEVGA